MDADDIKKIEEILKHHVGVMAEDFQQKLDIIAEGHPMLSDKIDRVEGTLGARLDRVERCSRRRPCRAPGRHRGARTVYRVKEGGG